MASFLRLQFVVSEETEDLLIADLWSWGTLGLEELASAPEGRTLLAYFTDPPPRELPPLDGEVWRGRGVELLGAEICPATDWLATYRRQARPFELGRRFLIDPREPGEDQARVSPSRHLLHLPARSAFGTGSHASTRLVVELMEGMEVADRRVIDVGAGTGILSLVALVLGARFVVACDVDLTAAFAAGQNSRLNRQRLHLVAGSVKSLASPPLFDLALVNVLPGTIVPHLPWLIRLLEADGEALVSGFVAEESEKYFDSLFELGFRRRAMRRDGDWVACHLELCGS